MHDPYRVIKDLKNYILKEDCELETLLEQSLEQARERGRHELNSKLFEALEWPANIEEYYDYVERFIQWIPQQSSSDAWKNLAPKAQYEKEVFDRLCHFFWLIDQKVGNSENSVVENSDWFRDWLTECARDWGNFLDTPESFSADILESFVDNAPEYHVEESLVDGKPNSPSGWLTFNQFFARELNAGLRPIAEPGDNRVITSPADCSYQQHFGIGSDSAIPGTAIKHTHEYGNVEQLLEKSEYRDAFAGGTFVHYCLPPSAYHRYHVPVSGRVCECYTITGRVYLQVNLDGDQFDARDSAQTGYEFSQTRGVLTLDTSDSKDGNLGIVGVVPVGMSHVSSVNLTAVTGKNVAKGDEFGYFQFGGSDIILLFQKGVDPQIDTDSDFRLFGSAAVRCQTID